jgi:hypothetical protein
MKQDLIIVLVQKCFFLPKANLEIYLLIQGLKNSFYKTWSLIILNDVIIITKVFLFSKINEGLIYKMIGHNYRKQC